MSTDNIISLGNNALTALWDVSFVQGIPTGGNDQNVTLRCDMSLTLPTESVGTYTVWKKGVKVDYTNTLTETTKEFQIEFRVDQEWETYTDINNWFKAVYDPITGTAMPDALMRTTIEVQAVDTQNVVKKKFRFNGCKPKSVQLTAFDNTNGEPVRCTVDFIYVDLIPENA